jgi:hypothetical protein
MKRFFIKVWTHWCGEQEEYTAYANTKDELQSLAQELAYENFNNYPGTGYDAVLEELFPDVEEGEYTDEMQAQAGEAECDYYGFSVEEWTGDEEDWSDYDLVYDGREKENAEV